MIKKIEVMGLELDNYSYSEALSLIESFLGDTALSPVLNIDAERLLEADRDEVVRQVIENAAFTVITDEEILTAGGDISASRLSEVKNRDFFIEFMNKMHQADRSVFLVGSSENEIERFEQYLLEQFPHLRILGTHVISDKIDENGTAVNSMNISMPDLILSVLETPKQEYFLKAYQNQICARIWYGIGMDPTQSRKSAPIRKFLRSLIGERKIRSKMLDGSSKGEHV